MYTMPHSEESQKSTAGWGCVAEDGSEIWDSDPVFVGVPSVRQKLKLLFYPKKLLLFWWIGKNIGKKVRILDVGCGTGAALIEMKALFGARAELYGLDVFQMQIDIARRKLADVNVYADVRVYDGQHLPFEDNFFDAVYTSDVLGHVRDVPKWLAELSRVMKPDARLAMFAESALGRHAYIRNYLARRGVNTDPHAQFHISLYSKQELRELLDSTGFYIEEMWSVALAKFFVHPDEIYPALQSQKKCRTLRYANKYLFFIKRKLYPFSTALCELYCLVEMLVAGKRFESQGYIIWARKR